MNDLFRVSGALACAMGLAGCSGGGLGSYITPAPPPAATDIATSSAAFETAWARLKAVAVAHPALSAAAAADPDLQTAQYFVMQGYDLAARNCDTFFAKNRELRSDTSFAKDTLVAMGTAAGVLAGLAGATATALTAVLGTTGIVPTTLDNFNKTYLMSDIADAVAPKVHSAMQDFRAANDPSKATMLNAPNMVREYARICTVASMVDIAKTALGNMGATAGPSTGTPPAGTPAPAPGAHVLSLPVAPVAPDASRRSNFLGRNGSVYYYSIR
jgi:hypothetical protein